MQRNCCAGLKTSSSGKERGEEFLNDQCFRDSLGAIRKFVVARGRTDERESKKEVGFIIIYTVRTAVGCQ